MKYFLIAGEASGDLHASNLMKGIVASDGAATFQFLGGDLMQAVGGVAPLRHYADMNFMGIMSVVKNLGHLSRIFKMTERAIEDFAPDVVILVDYAGFNLRMAKFAKKKGLKVFYYIAPKVWAWRKKRVKKIRKYVDRVFGILPFEIEFFKENGVEVAYFGNPIRDAIETFRKSKTEDSLFRQVSGLDERPVIALLAGSRRQEIALCLPEMVVITERFPAYQFVVAGAPSVDAALYEEYLKGTNVKVVFEATYSLLSISEAALVTSGTATLETALFHVPQVVIYKTGALTYRIGKLFVNFHFFSLVNLIFGRELVKELLQYRIAKDGGDELERILRDDDYKGMMMEGYAAIEQAIGVSGSSQRVANKMVELLSEQI